MESSDKKIKLRTCDEVVVEIDRELVLKSVLLKGILDDNPESEEEIPLPEVRKIVLDVVIKFLEHMKTNEPPKIEKPLMSTDLKEATTEFYADLMNIEDEEFLNELLFGANYLDIKPLLDLVCAKIGTKIKNMTIPEMRTFFSIENDFTPEEEKQAIEENKWADETA